MSFRNIFAKLLIISTLLLGAHAVHASPVNINAASPEEIAEALDGVGITKARAIVAYRNANGPFQSRAELANVKGIGERTVAMNEANILLSSEARVDDE